LSGWRTRSCGITAAVAAIFALAGCGGGSRQDVSEPNGSFTVEIPTATFPVSQRLAQHTHLVITVRNASSKTIPDIAVTIVDPKLKDPTSAQAFGQYLPPGSSTPGLASRSRPVWIVDRGPGPCQYSCLSGGPGGAVTAYSNTWALGALKPGASATFDWALTAVKSGNFTIQYQIAAGLNGKAKAVLAGGSPPQGTFIVSVKRTPAQAYVTGSGAIIKTH
jgi:hypothetical protein